MKKSVLITVGVLIVAAPAAVVLLNVGGRIHWSDGPGSSIAEASDVSVSGGDSVTRVNGEIRVAAGDTAGSLKSVNGSIRIGDGASATAAKVVNGSISVGKDANVVETAGTVNGSVSVGTGATIGQDLKTVNGKIHVDNGARVTGIVESVNGPITLVGAEAGALSTTDGEVKLEDGAVVLGDLTVEEPQGFGISLGKHTPPRISIGENCEVRGKLVFKQKVELHVADSAKVGPIEGVEPDRR